MGAAASDAFDGPAAADADGAIGTGGIDGPATDVGKGVGAKGLVEAEGVS